MPLLIISFVAGVLTVLAPCVLPLLPVIVGGSLAGNPNKRRAITITASLGVSVILFTYLLKASTVLINVPQSFWHALSGGILIIVGLFFLFPSLWDRIPFVNSVNRAGNRMMGTGNRKASFWGDVIIGASLGPVFSSCSPTYFVILATVLPASPFLGFIYLLAYALGLSVMLLLIALIGERLIEKLGIVADPSGWFTKIIGILFLLVGVAILTGFDAWLEAYLLSGGFFDVTNLEQFLLGSR